MLHVDAEDAGKGRSHGTPVVPSGYWRTSEGRCPAHCRGRIAPEDRRFWITRSRLDAERRQRSTNVDAEPDGWRAVRHCLFPRPARQPKSIWRPSSRWPVSRFHESTVWRTSTS